MFSRIKTNVGLNMMGSGTGGMIDTPGSVTAPVVFDPEGAAYVDIRTGVVMAVDHQE